MRCAPTPPMLLSTHSHNTNIFHQHSINTPRASLQAVHVESKSTTHSHNYTNRVCLLIFAFVWIYQKWLSNKKNRLFSWLVDALIFVCCVSVNSIATDLTDTLNSMKFMLEQPGYGTKVIFGLDLAGGGKDSTQTFGCFDLSIFTWWLVKIQKKELETLEHNPLETASSRLHHLQHWIWAVRIVWCVMFAGVCLCVWLYVLGCADNNIGDVGAQSIGGGLKSLTSLTTLNLSGGGCVVYVGVMFVCVCSAECWWNVFVCVGMYREQHWRRWSTVHWWWSQITHISYNAVFE